MEDWKKKDYINHLHNLVRYENENKVDFSVEKTETRKIIYEMAFDEISTLKQEYERRVINDAYNKEKYRKHKRIKLPIGQTRLEK